MLSLLSSLGQNSFVPISFVKDSLTVSVIVEDLKADLLCVKHAALAALLLSLLKSSAIFVFFNCS